jgi:hypothetical protein
VEVTMLRPGDTLPVLASMPLDYGYVAGTCRYCRVPGGLMVVATVSDGDQLEVTVCRHCRTVAETANLRTGERRK